MSQMSHGNKISNDSKYQDLKWVEVTRSQMNRGTMSQMSPGNKISNDSKYQGLKYVNLTRSQMNRGNKISNESR